MKQRTSNVKHSASVLESRPSGLQLDRSWLLLLILLGVLPPLIFVLPQFVLASSTGIDTSLAIEIMVGSKYAALAVLAAGALVLCVRRLGLRKPLVIVAREGAMWAVGVGIGIFLAFGLFVGATARMILR